MRTSKINLLEGIMKGEISINSLSFEPGNYIRIGGSDRYVNMERTKEYSYSQLCDIAKLNFFKVLNPVFTSDNQIYPLCITLVRF